MSAPVTLALGSVQFGLAYGIAGRGEAVPADEAREVLEAAWLGGIRLIDTAPVYGDIEQRLLALSDGRPFEFVSKIPALAGDASDHDVVEQMVGSIARSRQRLGSGLKTLLFHHGKDLCGPRGELAWRTASDALAGSGIALGGSFYSPSDASAARARFPIAVAQMPGNVFDQRLTSGAVATALGDVEIHLRSVFLQGLLLHAPSADVRVPKAIAPLKAWSDWCAEHGVSPLRASLGVARALPRVRCCVVGVDRVAQLREILQAWSQAQPLALPALACADEDVIDPRRWGTA